MTTSMAEMRVAPAASAASSAASSIPFVAASSCMIDSGTRAVDRPGRACAPLAGGPARHG
jgi:hypothetical protein